MPYNFKQPKSINVYSELLSPNVKQSKVTEEAKARGDFFLRADLVIKNNQDGTIGALAVAYTRFPVDEAYITLYLDQFVHSPAHRARRGVDPGAQVQAAFMQHIHQHQQRNAQQQQEQFQLAGQA